MNGKTPIYVAVVDDDESQCRSFGRLLRAFGMQPIIYSSVESFLVDVKRPRFDCLVLDIQFDGMSGMELQKRLPQIGAQAPVIFVTAHDEPEIRDQAFAGGCTAFFRKTEPGANVIEAIHRAMEHRQ